MSRVCVLTGGGDAPGVNAVLRAFVHAARRYRIDLMACRYGFEGLLAPDGIVPLSIADVRGILPRGGSVLGCSTRINPFVVQTKGSAETADMGPAIVDRLRTDGIDGLVLIGGDGTMLAASRFMKLGLETIDNDLG
jgi:ATP-dependent phosphofructokinase / diphosphate-dependent phosphofructokinase